LTIVSSEIKFRQGGAIECRIFKCVLPHHVEREPARQDIL
jgi:hypothetical protein